MYTTLKRRLYLILDPVEGNTRWDKVVDRFIIALIVINTAALILETVQTLYQTCKRVFIGLELFSIICFSIEYLLRVWSCTSNAKYSHPVKGRLAYIFSYGALVDLLSIIPFYLPFIIKADLRFIRLLRLVRFVRFFKLGRYTKASDLIRRVFKAKKEELVLSLVITAVLIVIASCFMYFVEHDVQPEKFSSIPETMWWSVATLTTVGYGDLYPITILGKTLTAFISILGIGMFALPAGILASGFSDEFKKQKINSSCCPECGRELEHFGHHSDNK